MLTQGLQVRFLSALSEEEQVLHGRIVELRNKAIAHSTWSLNPTELLDQGVFVGREFTIWREFQEKDVSLFVSLIRKVCDRAHNLRADYARR